jgi:hypothetical protein
MKINTGHIEPSQGKQKGYDVVFKSPCDVSNYHGEYDGVPLTYFFCNTPEDVVRLSKQFRCKSIATIHYPNMATRTIVHITITGLSKKAKD